MASFDYVDLFANGALSVNSGTFVGSLEAVDAQCVLYGVDGFNKSAGTVYIMVFDAAALPANGTVVPVVTPIKVLAGQNFSLALPPAGVVMANGIVVAASSTLNTGANVTLTVLGSTDVFIDVQYKLS